MTETDTVFHDHDRIARKISLLLSKHQGRDLFSVLSEKSFIKDEFISLFNLPNHLLEKHLDRALEQSQ